jgi:protein phosphatase PTC1
MIVRFDGKAVQEAVANNADPIGVEGDPNTKKGGLSEAEHIVLESKKKLDESDGEQLDRITTQMVEAEKAKEAGPEMDEDQAALAQAARDIKAHQMPPGGES